MRYKHFLPSGNYASKILYMCPLFLFIAYFGKAQIDQNNPAIKKLTDIANAYKNANHLGFDVKYLYASEARPALYLDSLDGSFKINNNRYNYTVDNTQFVGNDSINLTIFNEDKIIYVNSPANIQSANPLAMIDSVMTINQYSNASISQAGLEQKITIDFKPGYMFKKVEYYITPLTNLITRMMAIIEADQMYDPGVKPIFNKSNRYGILEVRFRSYKLSGFLDAIFSETQFLVRDGNQYKPARAYANYQIINGYIR